MSKRFLSAALLSLFAIGESGFAQLPICNSVQECQAVIFQAETRLQELSNGHSSQRISSTGAIFTRDTSNSALGVAYKDPSGLIWGGLVTALGKIHKMDQFDAEKYCIVGGARLPTKEEFDQLAKYLGKGTAQGYSPYLADGKTDFLPGLSQYTFWSSSLYPDPKETDFVFFFNGNDGSLSNAGYRWRNKGVRCVFGR